MKSILLLLKLFYLLTLYFLKKLSPSVLDWVVACGLSSSQFLRSNEGAPMFSLLFLLLLLSGVLNAELAIIWSRWGTFLNGV